MDNTCKITQKKLDERIGLNANDLIFYGLSGSTKTSLNFIEILSLINDDTNNLNHELWKINTDSSYTCKTGTDDTIDGENIIFHPKKCLPKNRDWIEDSSASQEIKDKAEIITSMNIIVDRSIKPDSSDDEDSVVYLKHIMNDLERKYNAFLNSYVEALEFFDSKIKIITARLNEFNGEGGEMFSFVNCKFIGTNLKILLKYLHDALGVNFYTVGICLLLVGCSMALSICFTILLIVIINSSVDSNKKTS